MSILKNNGINLGEGDPSSIANGDIKIQSGSLYVRDGGAWTEVGASNQSVSIAAGSHSERGLVNNDTGVNDTRTVNHGLGHASNNPAYWTYHGNETRYGSGTGASFTLNAGGTKDQAQSGTWMALRLG